MPATNEKNIALLCNAIAGNGRAVSIAEKISATLLKDKIANRLFKDSWPAGLTGFTDVFIIGGDGTLNYFINQYPGVKLPLVLFKGGTGNDFHWLLYGDIDFEMQLQLALNANAKPIDVGKCNGRYFANGIGIGFEGAVVKALTGKQKRPGKTSFFISILKNIFTYRSGNYTITTAGQKLTGKRLLVDISNGRRAGGGFYIAPVAKADDGLLDVILADALNPLQRLRYLPIIEKGKHLRLSFIHHFLTKKISIECDQVASAHLDGEYFEAQKFDIEIFAGELWFRY